MLNVTDQYCISPATSKGGFSRHPVDLSRKFPVTGHVSQGSEAQTELIQSETPPTSITDLYSVKER